jgi:hypothetical protein
LRVDGIIDEVVKRPSFVKLELEVVRFFGVEEISGFDDVFRLIVELFAQIVGNGSVHFLQGCAAQIEGINTVQEAVQGKHRVGVNFDFDFHFMKFNRFSSSPFGGWGALSIQF